MIDRRNRILQAIVATTLALSLFFGLYWVARTLRLPNLIGGAPSDFATGETKLGEFREGNEMLPGRLYIVEVTVYAEENDRAETRLKDVVANQGSAVRLAVSQTLRSAHIADLTEPTLSALKRKMKIALADATGRDAALFQHLLIPEYDLHSLN